MELKKRIPPRDLQVLNHLAPRFKLSDQDKQYHYRPRKGFEGELRFDQTLHDHASL